MSGEYYQDELVVITPRPGRSAYEYAVRGGYAGTEGEFSRRLAFLMNGAVVGYAEGSSILLSGDLATGTYTLAYVVRKSDGTTETVTIGTYTVEDETVSKTYIIKWVNYDGTVLETDTVTEGETPEYNSATPTRDADSQYTYTFTGWDKTVVAAAADATYTAQYTQTATPTEPAYDNLLIDAGYTTGKKVSTSSGNLSDADACASGFIDFPPGSKTVYIKNITFSQTANINNIVFYSEASASAKVGFWVGQTGGFNNQVTANNGVYTFGLNDSSIKYFRFSCAVISDDTIVTVDQEI